MGWSKTMEDNQDYFTENTREGRNVPLRGVDINGLIFPSGGSASTNRDRRETDPFSFGRKL